MDSLPQWYQLSVVRRRSKAGEGGAVLAVLKRVIAEVVGVHVGVVVEEHVLVGSVGELGIGGAGGDFFEFSRLIALDLFVGVFDGPIVVRSDGGSGVVALGL